TSSSPRCLRVSMCPLPLLMTTSTQNSFPEPSESPTDDPGGRDSGGSAQNFCPGGDLLNPLHRRPLVPAAAAALLRPNPRIPLPMTFGAWLELFGWLEFIRESWLIRHKGIPCCSPRSAARASGLSARWFHEQPHDGFHPLSAKAVRRNRSTGQAWPLRGG